MTDISSHPEKQIEQTRPKIEGAIEANAKLANARDVSKETAPAEPGSENEKLKLATRDQEQGGEAERKLSQAHDVPRYNDQSFTDKQGRPIITRSWQSGDLTQVRAYAQNVQQPREIPDIGQAGYANMTFEHSPYDGTVTRARLNDIETSPAYRGSGIGGRMLDTCEQTASKRGAKEIYGTFDPHGENPAAVHEFYERHGYSFRSGATGGEEVFKKLN